MPELNDNSKMGYGKYERKRMIELPASYLNYFWVTGRQDAKLYGDVDPVRRYIKRNLARLKAEFPRGDWK